jgi:hypothetical protein
MLQNAGAKILNIFYPTKRSYEISACNLTIRTKTAFFSLQFDYYAFFVVSNSYLAQFQSAAAFEAAVKSYGGLTQDEFLTPNVDSIVAPNV